VLDDQLAVVVVQVRPRRHQPPAVAGRGGVALVDLYAYGVTDEEHLENMRRVNELAVNGR
jgi:hypothetical protein